MRFYAVLAAICVLCAASIALQPRDCAPATPRDQILVGTGCGIDKSTMVAWEEDQFPTMCDRIDVHNLPQ